MLRIQQCLDSRLAVGGEVVSLTSGRALLPRNIFLLWYSFLIEVEQTTGASAAGRIR
jgi:hypothetical protein